MKERPILFSAPMVRAILDGKKTQTRRVVKPQPIQIGWFDYQKGFCAHVSTDDAGTTYHEMVKCPYGQPGDHLWCKESYWLVDMPGMGDWPCLLFEEEFIRYSDGTGALPIRPWESDRPITSKTFGHKPSIFMPRWASRLTLEIVSVRVERLQDISPEDAITEGVCRPGVNTWECATSDMTRITWCHPFAQIWDSLNGKRHPWQSNPWVWVVEFKAVQK